MGAGSVGAGLGGSPRWEPSVGAVVSEAVTVMVIELEVKGRPSPVVHRSEEEHISIKTNFQSAGRIIGNLTIKGRENCVVRTAVIGQRRTEGYR